MERKYRAVQTWCEDHGYGAIQSVNPVGGGCINDGAVIETEQGRSFFVKTNRNAPPDMFPREAEGLQKLAVDDGPTVPRVYHAEERFILLENLCPAPKKEGYWIRFGKELACLHQHTNDRFGFPHNNYIGSTPQINAWEDDGFVFFAQHRLLYQARLGRETGKLSRADVQAVERLAHRLESLVPGQHPSLIHGDLWSGNAISDQDGSPAIIDPAAYYGWAEAELAMTSLFGGFPPAFYEGYEEHASLEAGYRDRFPVYNLYHLLNHVNLFGGGYLSQVRTVLKKYA